VQIVLCMDENYAPMACVTLTSLLLNRTSNGTIEIHLCHNGISDRSLGYFRQLEVTYNCKVNFYFVSLDKVDHLRAHLHISNVMYFRLLLPEILKDKERILYLDCDLIVETDLTELWNIDLNGTAVAGWDEGNIDHLERLSLTDFYINSGVLIMDLDSWRVDGLGSLCLDWIQHHKDLAQLPDQDAINVVLTGRKTSIHERFNLNPVWRHENDLLERYPQRILHFGGPIKPWDECYDFNLAEIYRRYVSVSPCRGNFPFRSSSNEIQTVQIGHQLYMAGKIEQACRRYHDAITLAFRGKQINSLLTVRSVNHGVAWYHNRNYVQACEHFLDALESMGFSREYSRNLYTNPGILNNFFK